ncbi:SusC/RagA family TonB-linked outer membrane protein [Aquimarina sp. Aq78]|uniref:SusC/RagA family TonB-linked outer membrane protein n=1 Tax=Aquimarina sp. Aq78 TaxID=1191889 RepID=UPI001F41E28F|nr:SusC/RagA family TonB-linked outer membrane protein [Aquimarina sp. Aq78]
MKKHNHFCKMKILLLLIFVPTLLLAQETITGKVVVESTGEGAPFMNVIEEGTNNGTSSDIDGNFSITVNSLPVNLKVFALGFAEKTVSVATAGNITIQVAESTESLEEVVVTGLATSVKRSNAANAVASISAEELVGSTPPPTLDGALYGKFAGAIVSANSGAPGGGLSVKLRGITSIAGNSQPLYIVDGVYIDNSSIAAGLNTVSGAAAGGSASNQDNPTNRIADINPDDIANIEILKGASAAAIYGSRASAGVVIITTKRGKAGKTSINITQSNGFTQAIRLLGVRNYTEQNITASGSFDNDDLQNFIAARNAGRLVDYEEELFGEEGFISKTNLNVSGGGEKTTFYAGISHQNEDGIVKRTGYEKTSLRLNIDHKITDNIKLSLSNNYIQSSSDRGFFNNDNTGTTIGVALTSTTPWLNLFPDANGVYPDNPSGASNILQTRDLITNNEKNKRFIAGANLDVNIYKSDHSNLKAVLRAGIDAYTFETLALFPKTLQFQNPDNGGVGGVSAQGTTRNTNNNYSGFLVHNYFTDSNLNFRTQVGLTRELFDQNSVLTTATGLVSGQTNLNLSAARNIVQNRLKQEDFGFFVQEEINYQDKIIGTIGVRGDKSSNNTDVNQFFYYPKASLAVNIPKFGFWSLDQVNELKLRIAYGEAGNFPFFGANTTIFTNTAIAGLSGITLNGQLGNTDIEPERQKELEFGFDLGLLDNRVGLQFTYYQKKVDDLIISSAIEPSTGFISQVVNAGNLENKGFEVSLNAVPISNDNFEWSTFVTFFKNTSEITKLNIPAFNTGAFGATLGTFRIEEGKSATQIVGITPNGLAVLGDAEPDFQMSFQNSLKYKNFDLSFLWQWKKGGDNVNLTALLTDLNGTSADYDDIDLDPAGVLGNGDYRQSQLGVSARPFVEDASYLRLRELGLYYNVPSKILQNWFGKIIESAKIGFSGTNIINVFDYNSYDPEVSNFGSNGISTGVEVTPFPSSKRYLFHLSVSL